MAKGITNLSLESTIERNILKYLNSLPRTKAVKWSQEGRQKGMPDIICCHNGILILIEVKQPGQVPTLLQQVTMDTWVSVGAIGMVVTNVDQVKRNLSYILGVEDDIIKETRRDDNGINNDTQQVGPMGLVGDPGPQGGE